MSEKVGLEEKLSVTVITAVFALLPPAFYTKYIQYRIINHQIDDWILIAIIAIGLIVIMTSKKRVEKS